MQDPLKQGLKHRINNHLGVEVCIRMQDPLKQGLKLICEARTVASLYDSNARSIKTRIETCLTDFKTHLFWLFECKIH